MNVATKRTLIGAAALTAASLFGSLPYHGPWQAQGAPTVHRDIALVDTASDILSLETGLDDQVFAGILGPTGAEEQLYQSFVTAVGESNAQILLDTNTADPVFSGVINGAVSRLSDSLLYDTWAGENEINALFGVSATASESAILADIHADFVPLPTGFELPDVGDPNFSADLMAIASADMTTGYNDLLGYFADVTANLGNLDLGDLGGLSGLLGDLTGGLDLGSILGDLTGGLL